MKGKVHRVQNNVIHHYKTIPYDDLAKVLREGGDAFLENSEEYPLKRQTVWKASKKLSQMVGKKVQCDRALLRVDGEAVLEGYSFSIEGQESRQQKDTAS